MKLKYSRENELMILRRICPELKEKQFTNDKDNTGETGQTTVNKIGIYTM